MLLPAHFGQTKREFFFLSFVVDEIVANRATWSGELHPHGPEAGSVSAATLIRLIVFDPFAHDRGGSKHLWLGSWNKIAIDKLLPLHIWRVLVRSPHTFFCQNSEAIRRVGRIGIDQPESIGCLLAHRFSPGFLKGPVVECWNWPGGFGRSGGTLCQNGEEE